MTRPGGFFRRPRDYPLRDWARIRLVDARPRDVAWFEHHLAIAPEDPTGEAEMTIRFVDRIELPGRLRIIGGSAGWSGDTFVVLGRDGSPRATLPFDRLGRGFEIVCRSGAGIPQLVALVNLVLLERGVLALHASAVVRKEVGLALVGWSGGGRTEALLALVARGATAIADEWTYLTGDRLLAGLPQPVRVRSWVLADLPEFATPIGPAAARARAAGALAGAGDAVVGRVGALGPLDRLLGPVRARAAVDVSPARLFGADAIAAGVPLGRLLLVVEHAEAEIAVRPADPDEVAARMAASLAHHRAGLMDLYWRFAFAFPDRRTARVEEAAIREAAFLRDRLRGVPAAEIAHPARPSLRRLGDALARSLDEAPDGEGPEPTEPGREPAP